MNLQLEYQQALELLYKEDYVTSEIYLKNVLSKNPQHAGALVSYFNCLYKQQRYQEALPFIARLYSHHSESREFTWLYIECLNHAGCYQDIIPVARKYIENNGGDDRYIAMLAQAYYKNKDVVNGTAFAHWAFALDDQNVENLLLLVEIYQAQNNSVKSKLYLEKYLEINPKDYQRQLLLGDFCNQLHFQDEAYQIFKSVLQMYPDNQDLLTLVGKQATDVGDFGYAESLFIKVIERDSNYYKAFFHYGFLKFEEGDYQKAIELYKKVIQLNPDFSVAYYNLSLCYFALGYFDKGFEYYQWRWKMPQNMQHVIHMPIQEWSFDLHKTSHLLVWSEQGVGDIVFFARALVMLNQAIEAKNAEMKITFACDLRLTKLFQLNISNIQVIPYSKKNIYALLQSESPPSHHISTGDLLAWVWQEYHLSHLDETQKTIDKAGLQLNQPLFRKKLDRALLIGERQEQEISSKIEFTPKLRIGIAWHSTGERYGASRSLKLQDFMPVFKSIKNAVWVSLQYGDHQEEIHKIQKKLPKHSYFYQDEAIDNHQDLYSLSAMMQTLDLVVSIDNSTIHLAGALNVPSLLLLKEPYNWRWPLVGDQSFWYPSVSLLRWKKSKDLKKLMSEINLAIEHLNSESPD